MKHQQKIFFLLLIAAIALLLNVGSYGVVETSDARYADISREMYVSGDYLHPNLLGVHHYHKPPFTYQISSLGISIFGVNAFGVRFFLQLTVLLQIVLVYALALLLFSDKKTALWSALIYFSFPIVLISSRNLTTDAFLTTFVLLSIYAWVKYRKQGKVIYLYLFTLSLALGFLTKGPVIFIVPLPFILAYNKTEPSKHKIGKHHILAWLLFLVAGFSWYVYLAFQNPDYINYFLGRQTVDRFSKNVFHRTEPFWYFIVYAPLIGLPWLLLLPYLVYQNKSLFTKKNVYTALLAGILIPLLFFLFFSISSSKRILYILPVYSLAAVLIACLWFKLNESKAKMVSYTVIGFVFLMSVIFMLLPFIKTGLNIPKVFGLSGLITLISVVIISKSPSVEMKSKPVLISFIFAIVLLVGSSFIMAHNQLEINASKPVTDFIIQNNLNQRDILVFDSREPSIAFGLNKSIISINNGSRDLQRETQFEEDTQWKNYLIDIRKEDERQHLKEVLKKPTVLLIYKKEIPKQYNWLLSAYPHKKQMGNWVVYY